MTEPLTGLTGAEVRRLREHYGLSRAQFTALAGFSAGARIGNIEAKDSWKAGDREAVERVLNGLADGSIVAGKSAKTGRRKGESGDERAARLQAALAANGHALPDVNESYLEPPVFNPFLDPDDEDDEVSALAAEEDAQPWADLDQRDVIAARTELKLLSNSEIETWKRCRRKWWLTFYRRLVTKSQDMVGPRAIGNRVHRALAAYYVPEGATPTDPREALEREITRDWTTLAEQTRATVPEGEVDTVLGELATRYNDAVTLERAMIEGYLEWVEETGADANLRVTDSETALQAEITVDVEGDKVPVRLIGLLDVRARRSNDGVRLFTDHKTVGDFTRPRKTLHGDPQMLFYHLLEFLNGAEGDERCDGALYNMLRKVKRSASAKPPFYDRVEVHHSRVEIESYMSQTLGAAHDILIAQRRLAQGLDPRVIVYKTWGESCSWGCDFFSICPMIDDGSRVEDAITALYDVGDPLARYDGKFEQ